jgi:hypothetical protein
MVFWLNGFIQAAKVIEYGANQIADRTEAGGGRQWLLGFVVVGAVLLYLHVRSVTMS